MICFEYSFQEYFFEEFLMFFIKKSFLSKVNISISFFDISLGSFEQTNPDLSLIIGVLRPSKFVVKIGTSKLYARGRTPLCDADLYVKAITSEDEKKSCVEFKSANFGK